MKISINDKTTDEEIVELTRKSDKEYFGYLIDRYEFKLLSYVKRLTSDSSEAEDLVQQVFMNAFVSLNSFDSANKFSSWIYRIAHNLAVNWLKKKKAQFFLDNDDVMRFKSEIDIEEEIIAKENGKILAEAINKLPQKYKDPFVLKYFEDKSYEEISFILKLPKNTVGTFINRAKKFLRNELEKKHVR